MSLWSEQEVATLRQMVDQGARWKVIAAALKRSIPAVVGKAAKLGIRLDPAVVSRHRAETITAVNRTPEQRRKAAEGLARRNHARLSWCRPEWRADYHSMIRKNKYTAAQAREIIERSYAR